MPKNFSPIQYNSLLQILRENHACWDHEILHGYPHSLQAVKPEWLEAISKLSLDQLWLMDSKQSFAAIADKQLRTMLEKLEELTQVPLNTTTTELPADFNIATAFYRVRGKKKHEIETLAPVLKSLYEQKRFRRLVDIGGGQGHLGRVMARHLGVPTVSLDRDLKLQELGKINLNRLSHRKPPEGASELHFEFCDLNKTCTTPKSMDGDAFVLGLHTCGDLALDLIEHSIRAQCAGLLSFGCCYSKMALDQRDHAINGPKSLAINNHALTLATRGHKSDTRKDFELKLLVKRHRYTLHLFHYYKFNRREFIPMGETIAREYKGRFSEYAGPRLQAHSMTASAEELDAFYEDPEIVAKFNHMLCGNLIRWQFGRALELVILIDRCERLEAKGFQTELASYFDERQSPRNIGILAYR